MHMILTERQRREIEYHKEHARSRQSAMLNAPFSWDVLHEPGRRWWNAYWAMYAHLLAQNLVTKRVLVVGCGFGDDALRLAKLGARVTAFDLSPDALQVARALAARERLEIDFGEMPSEQMDYPANTFDCILARDILHHVDIPKTMREIVRVAKPGALFVVNEIYSHSMTDRIRHSALVERTLYPRMRRLIYGPGKPYITEDERKLSEQDLAEIMRPLHEPEFTSYFNFLVTRVVPDRYDAAAKIDRALMRLLKPIGRLIAGRVLFSARVHKPAVQAPATRAARTADAASSAARPAMVSDAWDRAVRGVDRSAHS